MLVEFIEGVAAGAEQDILILGDYNMIPVDDDSNFQNMSADGFVRFISSEDLVGQGTHIGNSGVGNLLDGFGISAEHTSEYVPGSLKIVDAHTLLGLSLAKFKEDVTDHLPVVARFRTESDDD